MQQLQQIKEEMHLVHKYLWTMSKLQKSKENSKKNYSKWLQLNRKERERKKKKDREESKKMVV